jgi:hypothetical protein
MRVCVAMHEPVHSSSIAAGALCYMSAYVVHCSVSALKLKVTRSKIHVV